MRRPIYLTLLACLFLSYLSSSAQTTWVGAPGGDWFDVDNWSAGLPTNGNNANIPPNSSIHLYLIANQDFNFHVVNMGSIDIYLNEYKLRLLDPWTNTGSGMVIINGDVEGAVLNQAHLINDGNMILTSCAEFQARNNSSVTGGGWFTNDGIVYMMGNGMVQITGGDGVLLDDLNSTPSPIALCIPNFTIQINNNNSATITPAQINSGSAAPYCDIASLSLSKTSFGCDDLGDNQVILSVTDELGNTSTCTTIITVEDVVPPIIYCPNNLTKELDPGACDGVVEFDFLLSASDNCTAPSLAQTDNSGFSSGDIFPIGEVWLTFEADDGFQTATCSFKITVEEFEPVDNGLACHDQINISLGDVCETYITPGMILSGDYGCYDDFVVMIEETGSNYINTDWLNELVKVKVTNLETGNSCWGYGLVEEKKPPIMEDCDPITISCVQSSLPISEGGDVPEPNISDCSGLGQVYYIDGVVTGTGNCSGSFVMEITRTWIASDLLGNERTCNQVITVDRTSLLDVTPMCPADKEFECTEVPGFTDDPDVTGYPTIEVNGESISIKSGNPGLCEITASYEDNIIPKCGAGFRILRTWLVADWCLPMDMVTNPWTCKQIIDFNDKTTPELEVPDDLTVSTNSNCGSTIFLPPAEYDDCSDVDVIIVTPVGPIHSNGGMVPAPGLSFGTHEVIYRATDACGNLALDTMEVTVVDNLIPYMSCIAETVVGLTSNGLAISYAETFDNGSFDNCCPNLDFEVRRMTDPCFGNTDFDDYVTFCCEDVGTTVMIVLRAWDCFDNYNECMIEVEVQDKLDPVIICPTDVVIECGEDPTDHSLTGTIVVDPALKGPLDGLAIDNCSSLIIDYQDIGALNCGQGTITRIWSVEDLGGEIVVCTQKISVLEGDPFDGAVIEWPSDTDVNNCVGNGSEPSIIGEPVIPPAGDCADIFVSYEDEFLTSQNTCLKILRHWKVVDWCVYQPNTSSSGGVWTYTQTIKILDAAPPTFSSCDDRTFCNFKADCSEIGLDLSVDVNDSCTDAADIELTWEIDEYDDGSIDDTGVGQSNANFFNIGTHRITYTAIDHCGNLSTCSFQFTLEDCRRPSVVCDDFIIEIMSTGMVDIYPTQFDNGSSSDNCSAYDDLRFSFSSDVDDTVLTLDCTNIGSTAIEIWVTDEAGNNDFCTTQIILQDNMNVCGGGSLVAGVGGEIYNWEEEAMEDILIEISSSNIFTDVTNPQGVYHFEDLPQGNDYTVTPLSNDDPKNGVTTFDLVLLNQHVLGVNHLDTPYKLIAADVNNSGSISISDMVAIRKLILNQEDEFPNNNSWRFVEASYEFPDETNPFQEAFPEVYSINNLSGDMMENDFIAIKIGDLNGSAVTNSFSELDDRIENDPYIINVSDRLVKAGEQITIDFTTTVAALGYQFTLNFDQNALIFNDLGIENQLFNQYVNLELLDQGVIPVSWNNVRKPVVNEIQVLFSLTFTTRTSGKLSDWLSINSRFTKAEAYPDEQTILEVVLQFEQDNGTVVAARHFELYQNIPNPFWDETVIGFNLPEAATVTFKIVNARGQTIKVIHKNCREGFNAITLQKSELPRGILFYQLDTPTHSATRKLSVGY